MIEKVKNVLDEISGALEENSVVIGVDFVEIV